MINALKNYLRKLFGGDKPVEQYIPKPEFIPSYSYKQEIKPVPYDPAEWEDIGFSPLTWKVLGAKYGFALEEVPTWAYEMMHLGYDTPNLTIVAGISKPISYNDLVPYFEDALNDLGYPILTYDDAEVCYISIFIKKIANGIDVKSYLYKLNRSYFYESLGCLRYVYYAWQDLDRGEPFSYEWKDATLENIEQHCINEARNWLDQNSNFLQSIRKQLILKR